MKEKAEATHRPLSQAEIRALVDANRHPRGYYWKPVTMKKLADRGLVRRMVSSGNQVGYVLTDEGLKQMLAAIQGR